MNGAWDASHFKDRDLARSITEKIAEITPPDPIKICHVCGTHEWTITRSGLRALLPESVSLIAGPGCPVCIVPAREIDEAVWLALNGVTVTTLGDMYRVPGSEASLDDAKSRGGDVRVVYSVRDAVAMARREPEQEFVFFAIGFETTTPMNALEILDCPENMSFLVSHRLIPPAMEFLAEFEDLDIDGFIAPGHVSTIIGAKPYERFPEEYGVPTVVAGFESLDVLMTVYMILKQIDSDSPKLENEYSRAVTYEGNVRAQEAIYRVFDVIDGSWRGIGEIPSSTLSLKEEFSHADARQRYSIDAGPSRDIYPGCSCHLVILGKITPDECPLFMEECTPETPKGACMVSSEGTCKIWTQERL
ncbi:MAG: hydrogenase formation protein HypD [Candidatus Bathyarchaeota archaeon]|nr:hydrogenase formation protein HypD [Candidatus Bathyarchaeota archaeon]